MEKAKAIAKKYLNYVYLGNVLDLDSSTHCPYCGAIVIERAEFANRSHLNGSKCQVCDAELPIIND